MGKKSKKPFIDKKNASTYTLMHRSQAELALLQEQNDGVDGTNHAGQDAISASSMVLWPQNHNAATKNHFAVSSSSVQHPSSSSHIGSSSTSSSSGLHVWKEKLQQAQLVVDETTDSNRYLKEITGEGIFVNVQGQSGRLSTAVTSRTLPLSLSNTAEEDVPPLLFDNINLTTDFMDDDMAALLLADDDDVDGIELEELDDDFCFQAAQEPEEEQVFDYDAHIQQLLEKARIEKRGTDILKEALINHPGVNDQNFFLQRRPMGGIAEEDDDDDYDYSEGDLTSWLQAPGVVPKLSPDEERALCEKFESTLAEYDSSDEEDDEANEQDCNAENGDAVCGPGRELQGDKEIEAALDAFLIEKEDDIFIQAVKPRGVLSGGSGYSALIDKQMVPASKLSAAGVNDTDEVEPVEDIIAEAKEILSQPVQMIPPEEILLLEMDGKSYLSERIRNPWDCESILSTYSNLDNNPVVIEHRRRQQLKSKQILLSNKTGLPIQQPQLSPRISESNDETVTTINRGEARNKHETPEEKRARKAAAKVARQLSRLQKKVTRDVFQQEFQKRSVVTDTIAGSTVFRYS